MNVRRAETDYSYLPELLAEIAEVVGLDAAVKIAEARGGTSVYFPARVRPGHWLVEVIGAERAEKLCQHFRSGNAGVELTVPLGTSGSLRKLRSKADRLIAEGKSNAEAARATGYTIRTIERRRAKLRERSNSDQQELF